MQAMRSQPQAQSAAYHRLKHEQHEPRKQPPVKPRRCATTESERNTTSPANPLGSATAVHKAGGPLSVTDDVHVLLRYAHCKS